MSKCKCCDIESDNVITYDEGNYYIEYEGNQSILTIQDFEHDNSIHIPVKYCPNCGKEL